LLFVERALMALDLEKEEKNRKNGGKGEGEMDKNYRAAALNR